MAATAVELVDDLVMVNSCRRARALPVSDRHEAKSASRRERCPSELPRGLRRCRSRRRRCHGGVIEEARQAFESSRTQTARDAAALDGLSRVAAALGDSEKSAAYGEAAALLKRQCA
jgi:hypothetical protein